MLINNDVVSTCDFCYINKSQPLPFTDKDTEVTLKARDSRSSFPTPIRTELLSQLKYSCPQPFTLRLLEFEPPDVISHLQPAGDTVVLWVA
jgi:hypothetical protein